MQALAPPSGTLQEPLLAAFLEQKDLLPRTREAYRSSLAHFVRSLPPGGAVTPAVVQAYREGLLAQGFSPLSVGTYLSAVRVFFAWANANGYGANPAAGVRSPRVRKVFRRSPLSAELSSKVLQAARDARERLVLELELRAGLRGCEVVRANVGDRGTKDGRDVLYVQGKGRADKEEFVVLSPRVVEAWDAYLAERGPVRPSDPLFVSERGPTTGQRMTTRGVRELVTGALKRAKVKEPKVTAHSLRHSCAVHLRKNGATLPEVQAVLRHRSADTTAIYTAWAEDEVRLSRPAELLLDNAF